jgi:hypothetical protein
MKRLPEHPRNALSHPVFWAALALLLLNDHVLKRAALLPDTVTGKLSDFAGLLVAPVLAVAMFRVRGRAGRLCVFACVAAAFTTIKLSRPMADAVEAVTALTPLPWRLWCDPTDLVALSVLPLGFWLVGRDRPPAWLPRLHPRPLACVRAAGLVLGLFACAATSMASRLYRGTAFLFNGTHQSHTLRLFRLRTPLDCTRSLDAPAVWPGPDAFVLDACPTIASGDILLLDRGAMLVSETGGEGILGFHTNPRYDAGIVGPACDAVLLAGDGLRPVVISWNGVNAIEFEGVEQFGDLANDDHGLVLERAGERLFIQGTSLLSVRPAGFEPAATDCPNGER